VIVYCTAAIDFWNGWQTHADLFQPERDETGPKHPATEWPPLWEKAQELARRVGWEGDIRDGPYRTVLPDEKGGLPPVIIAWKQDNNGITFVASPYRLPWLDAECESAEG